MSLFKIIINHSLWLFIGNSIGRLTMFIANIFAARLLSQEIFGQYMMIRSTVSMMEGTITGSVGNIVIKTVSEEFYKYNKMILVVAVFAINTAISVLVIILLYVASPVLVDNYFLGQDNMVIGLYAGGGLFVVSLFASSTQAMLIGLEKYKEIAIVGVCNVVISLPFIYLLVSYYGFMGALIGVSIYFMLDFIMKYIVINKQIAHESHGSIWTVVRAFIKKISAQSGLLSLSIFVSLFTLWYMRVLTINKANAFSDIALFDAAYQWLTIIMLITGATTSVALQMLTKSMCDNSVRAKYIFYTSLMINSFIAIFIASIFAFLSKYIMSVYGEVYISSYYLIYILGIVAVLHTISSLLNKLLIANNDHKYIFYNYIFSSIMVIIYMKYNHISDPLMQLSYAFVAYYLTLLIIYVARVIYCNAVYFGDEQH